MVDQLCINCKFFNPESVKNKAGRVMKDRVARCQWGEDIRWPSSLEDRALSKPGYMQPYDGQDCSAFVYAKDGREMRRIKK